MATYWNGIVKATQHQRVVEVISGDDVGKIYPQYALEIIGGDLDAEIESVNTSNQTIVLVKPYPGATVTDRAVIKPMSMARLEHTTNRVQELTQATAGLLVTSTDLKNQSEAARDAARLARDATIAKKDEAVIAVDSVIAEARAWAISPDPLEGSYKSAKEYAAEASSHVATGVVAPTPNSVPKRGATGNVKGTAAIVDDDLVNKAQMDSEIIRLGQTIGRQFEPAINSWDPNNDTYDNMGSTGVTAVHRNMRRCLLLDDGTVNYYLDPNDSTKKLDGTPAVLDGTEGQVMVEIPTTWVRYSEQLDSPANLQIRETSAVPRPGFVVHPAFCIGGTFEKVGEMWQVSNPMRVLPYVYYGAYDACVYVASTDSYISGLNLDNATGLINSATDKLSSVSGVYPICGVTRALCRTLASNRGDGWSQNDFWVHALVQWLFATEYNNFNSQQVLAQGNVSSSYGASSSDQLDSPHSVAGKSNTIGNGSGGVASSARDTAWMSYRGIENFWGNVGKWVDGVNVNNGVHYVANDPTLYADSTAVGYTEIGTAPDSSGYISDVFGDTLTFVPKSNTGSSATAFSDYYYYSTGWRVALAGGYASYGAFAGAFCWLAIDAPASALRNRGSRLVFKPKE